jgi:hypothetical protein
MLVTAAAIGLTIVTSSLASVPVGHHGWRVAYRVLHRSDSPTLRRRVVRAGTLSRARASIVGGSQIAITQAPWQTLVVALIPKPEEKVLVLLCGGSVIGETRIVTAGHCVFDPTTGSRVPAEDMLVIAGTADFAQPEPGEQELKVASVRVHPDFEYALGAGASDDVAVLALAAPLTFNALVQPIGLVAAGAAPEEGEHVNLTGFGRETPTGSSEGPLHSIGMTVGFSRPCGGEADAVFLCASASGGSGCSGDSGSGLTGGSIPMLVGVMDTVEIISGEPCPANSSNGFVNIAAPEINDFIEGSETPPVAPRGGGAIVRAVTEVGRVATCEPGSWTGSPTFMYSFVNSASGQTLQSGSSATYQLTTADVGRTIYCQVYASNAGGTGVGRTISLRAIEAPPTPQPPLPPPFSPPSPGSPAAPVTPQLSGEGAKSEEQVLPTPSFASILSLTGSNLAVQRNGSVAIKLGCEGEESCSGELTLQAEQTTANKHSKKRSRTVIVGRVGFSIAPAETMTVTLRLNGLGLSVLRAAHGRLTARLEIAQTTADSAETHTVHLIEAISRGQSKRKE